MLLETDEHQHSGTGYYLPGDAERVLGIWKLLSEKMTGHNSVALSVIRWAPVDLGWPAGWCCGVGLWLARLVVLVMARLG